MSYDEYIANHLGIEDSLWLDISIVYLTPDLSNSGTKYSKFSDLPANTKVKMLNESFNIEYKETISDSNIIRILGINDKQTLRFCTWCYKDALKEMIPVNTILNVFRDYHKIVIRAKVAK